MISLTDDDTQIGQETYSEFENKEGSRHIASETALCYLAACLWIYEPRVVIECGAGIGTITSLVSKPRYNVRRLVAIENNAFCLKELEKNILPNDKIEVSFITHPKKI